MKEEVEKATKETEEKVEWMRKIIREMFKKGMSSFEKDTGVLESEPPEGGTVSQEEVEELMALGKRKDTSTNGGTGNRQKVIHTDEVQSYLDQG